MRRFAVIQSFRVHRNDRASGDAPEFMRENGETHDWWEAAAHQKR